MPNPKINNINVGGVDYDIGSTVLSFDTYDDYLNAHEAGDIPVGSTVFIKEGNQSFITANQVTYDDSETALGSNTVQLAIEELLNRINANKANIKSFIAVRAAQLSSYTAVPNGGGAYPTFTIPAVSGYTPLAWLIANTGSACVSPTPAGYATQPGSVQIALYNFTSVQQGDSGTYSGVLIFYTKNIN